MAKKHLTKAQKRKARLRKSKQWILKYQGSNILLDYGKMFKIDAICATKGLEAIGASTDEQLRLLQQREQIRLQKKAEERAAILQIESNTQILDSADAQSPKNSAKANSQRKKPKRRCINCGKVMTQQFIGLKHCKCGTSWSKADGYFERTPDMVFALERKVTKKGKNSIRTKQIPVIRYKEHE